MPVIESTIGGRPADGVTRESHADDAFASGWHCHYCGRSVEQTTHERGTYRVDGFALHTGETEEAAVRRPDSDEVLLVYRRLVRPVLLITCRDCYADPARRSRHERWEYP